MTEHHTAVAESLLDIEMELRNLRLWQFETLSDDALASIEPFAVDTMTFLQWLQFIFLPKMHFIVKEQLPLPSDCAIAPMAQHYFASLNLPSSALVHHLQKIDFLLSSNR